MMTSDKFSQRGLAILFALFSPLCLQSQGLNDWLDARVNADSTAAAGKAKPSQTSAISLDHGSTDIVDQSAGTDLANAILNLVPVNGNQSASGTVTASLYSLYAVESHQDPLKPSVYNAHDGLRTLFLTVGHEGQNASGSSTASSSGTIYGARWLPRNRRDATSLSKSVRDAIETIITTNATIFTPAVSNLASLLYAANRAKYKSLTDMIFALKTTDDVDKAVTAMAQSDRDAVEDLVTKLSRLLQEKGNTAYEVKKIQTNWQFALDFQTTQRSAASDEYRAELIFDSGLPKGWFMAMNGSYDYSNSAEIGGDLRSERGALELRHDITTVSPYSLKSPWQIALSGEGVRVEKAWLYRAQLQLEIPIVSGVTFPISVGYGNQRSDLSKEEKSVYGRFGFTFDVSKIASALTKSH